MNINTSFSPLFRFQGTAANSLGELIEAFPPYEIEEPMQAATEEASVSKRLYSEACEADFWLPKEEQRGPKIQLTDQEIAFYPLKKEELYFDYLDQDILNHLVSYLDETSKECLYKTPSFPTLSSRVVKALTLQLNNQVQVDELGLPSNEVENFVKRNGRDISCLNLRRISRERAVGLTLLCPNLVGLDLCGTSVTAEDIRAIVNSLVSGRLEQLHLNLDKIGDKGVIDIANAPHLSRLKVLVLSGCLISDKGIVAIANSTVLTRLRVLNLSCNLFTREGLRALCSSSNVSKLQHLDLSLNRFRDRDVVMISRANKLSQLRKLYLQKNLVTNAGALFLVRSRNLPLLEHLDLFQNKVDDSFVEDNESAIEHLKEFYW